MCVHLMQHQHGHSERACGVTFVQGLPGCFDVVWSTAFASKSNRRTAAPTGFLAALVI